MSNSTNGRSKKPEKPYKDFPLFAHATGRWAKKVKNKTIYFGPWDKPHKALDLWLYEKDYLLAGKEPPARGSPDDLTVVELINKFLSAKKHLVESKELSSLTFGQYHLTAGHLRKRFGDRSVVSLTPADFLEFREHLAKTRGPVALGNEVNKTRIIFRHAFENGLIESPVQFGTTFKKPTKKRLRRERATKTSRTFDAADLRLLIREAGVHMRAMILLGANCGLGNHDIACLPLTAVNLTDGWMNFPRPKTEVERRCSLWPETVAALREAIDARRTPKPDAEGLLFVTKQGRPWVRHAVRVGEDGDFKASWIDAVHLQFSKLLVRLELKKRGLSFYALRHLFETQGGESKDQVAVDAIMGHVDPSMAGAYREKISDDRLKAVVAVVRDWLWPSYGPFLPR